MHVVEVEEDGLLGEAAGAGAHQAPTKDHGRTYTPLSCTNLPTFFTRRLMMKATERRIEQQIDELIDREDDVMV